MQVDCAFVNCAVLPKNTITLLYRIYCDFSSVLAQLKQNFS